VAMANGVAAIQAAATHHTASNDDEGVAMALDLLVPA
jgi:hydroxymethylpyrimidine pyrophosphatase-like HAD family hydrolase